MVIPYHLLQMSKQNDDFSRGLENDHQHASQKDSKKR